jgi:hypothetical protein
MTPSSSCVYVSAVYLLLVWLLHHRLVSHRGLPDNLPRDELRDNTDTRHDGLGDGDALHGGSEAGLAGMHGADGLVVGSLGSTLRQLARHCIIARALQRSARHCIASQGIAAIDKALHW